MQLQEKVRDLEHDLADAQRALSESHAAFAEQMADMTMQHTHAMDNARTDLVEQLRDAQGSVHSSTTRISALEQEVASARKDHDECDARAKALAQRSDEVYAQNVELQRREKESAAHQRRMDSLPAEESLSQFAKGLGYDADTEYTLLESLHAAHNAKYTKLREDAARVQMQAARREECVLSELAKLDDKLANEAYAGGDEQLREPLRRQRSNSMEKGAAVLRALARTPTYHESQEPLPDSAHTDRVSTAHTPAASRYQYWVVQWEVPRKVLHCSIGFIVLGLYLLHVNVASVAKTLFYMLLVVASADLLRLNVPSFERLYEAVLGLLMRDGEQERVNGVVWYLIGVLASLHFFPEDIACVSVMLLSWCDPIASVAGRLYGRYTPSLPPPLFARRKSLAGFLAAGAMGTMIAYVFWGTSIGEAGERRGGRSWAPNGSATFGVPPTGGFAHTGWDGFSKGFTLHPESRLQAVFARHGAAMPPALWYGMVGVLGATTEALDLGGVDDNLSLPILSAFGMWAVLWVWGRWVGA
ncbi:diacylglycerol kinase (CTP) [Malassezia sp. CBS 17886]|nr:diacylglycerol kinase (CTP) [Malassezia sp. CBS 17886]